MPRRCETNAATSAPSSAAASTAPARSSHRLATSFFCSSPKRIRADAEERAVPERRQARVAEQQVVAQRVEHPDRRSRARGTGTGRRARATAACSRGRANSTSIGRVTRPAGAGRSGILLLSRLHPRRRRGRRWTRRNISSTLTSRKNIHSTQRRSGRNRGRRWPQRASPPTTSFARRSASATSRCRASCSASPKWRSSVRTTRAQDGRGARGDAGVQPSTLVRFANALGSTAFPRCRSLPLAPDRVLAAVPRADRAHAPRRTPTAAPARPTSCAVSSPSRCAGSSTAERDRAGDVQRSGASRRGRAAHRRARVPALVSGRVLPGLRAEPARAGGATAERHGRHERRVRRAAHAQGCARRRELPQLHGRGRRTSPPPATRAACRCSRSPMARCRR